MCAAKKKDTKMTVLLKCVADKMSKELGPSHKILAEYARKQLPQRTIPMLQLVELYIKIKGEQKFVDEYHNESYLYEGMGGFLKRSAQCNGYITISYGQSVIAQGQI